MKKISIIQQQKKPINIKVCGITSIEQIEQMDKLHIDFVGLECYLKSNLRVDESNELLEYLEIPHIMEKLRNYLTEGGQALFDNIVKHMQ